MTGGVPATVVGASRTDSGVHARGQVAHFDLATDIPAEGLLRGFNGVLPPEIRIRSVRLVSPSFHAIRDARGKLYTYRARSSDPTLPWAGLRTARMMCIEDPVAFREAMRMIPGRRDMASFSVTENERKSTVRTLYRVWATEVPGGLNLHFAGDGFLRYQVRRMVGALFLVGQGQLSLEVFRGLLEEPQPGASIYNAPAQGLTLERVYYRRSPLLTL